MSSFLDNIVNELHVADTKRTALVDEYKKLGGDPLAFLRSKKIASEEDIARALGTIFSLPFADVASETIVPGVIALMPEDVARNYQMVAYAKSGETVSIGLLDPRNGKAQEAALFLAKARGLKVKFFITTQSALDRAWKQYQILPQAAEEVLDVAKEKFAVETEAIAEENAPFEEVVKNAPVSQMVTLIVRHAVDAGASDIHIEPSGDHTKVRYRVDGVLRSVLTLPVYLHQAIISRVKVLANLKLDETRLPQDGRMKMEIGGRAIDFRVSIFPLIDYEKVVLRILESATKTPTLEELGFIRRSLDMIRRNIVKPNGLFLITGPTGSGKTTTLYVVLSMLNRDGVNIVTLEDPIEYFIPGINQAQIRPDINFTFANGLRSILRQDPNIIMVGEIRDEETAELAVHAGLTGHLVFSTLHTRDALGAMPRLLDMHVQPFLMGSTVTLIMGQRLVRKVCEACRMPASLPPELEKEIEGELAPVPEEIFQNLVPKKVSPYQFYQGKGCTKCAGTGYAGRTTIAEMIEMTDGLRAALAAGLPPRDVEAELAHQHFITIKQEGLLKALAGITSVAEVMRATRE
ncbi:type II/IV secretion system protein [Candidatus Uhrbacteria bacterium]|nr:type II/IV secretion system protein [Candidatus Uhrbacteria bacterium]